MKNNQQIGKEFENKFVNWLASLGYWAHFMHRAPDGSQPFDVIAMKGLPNGTLIYAVDCKTTNSRRFPLSRIEDNQELSFDSLNTHEIHGTYFAILNEKNNRLYLIPSQTLINLKRKDVCSINLEDYECYCIEQNFN